MNSSTLLHAISYHDAAHEVVASVSVPLRLSLFQDLQSAHDLDRNTLHHRTKALAGLRSLVEDHDAAQIATEFSVFCHHV